MGSIAIAAKLPDSWRCSLARDGVISIISAVLVRRTPESLYLECLIDAQIAVEGFIGTMDLFSLAPSDGSIHAVLAR